jgi:two-component system chemotaxis sensor kinase CheA
MARQNTSSPESKTNLSPNESGRQIRVLLAEDDRALRRFLEVVLERAGYQVVSASDGLEAMKLVLSTPIDVVVTDAMMPNLSGHEFCRFLRNSPALAQLPVILLSALERKDANKNAEQADAFLSKPVSGEDLVECIEKLLASRKGQDDRSK